jgi:uncharacterized damage-inducible protein DinB
MTDRALREQVTAMLHWEDAHADFGRIVDGVPPSKWGAVPPGLPYSLWQLLEHLRIAQYDILDFCRNPHYAHPRWPEDYWPREPGPPGEEAVAESIAAFVRDREGLMAMGLDPKVDLFARIPHGTGQTYLREILLVADHTAYHLGQMVAVRRALGIWD